MEVTIKDVAREAGVAISTVSKVINGSSVREANRIRVEDAIRKLGYSPNNRARGLRNSRTYTVGLLIETIEGVYWAKLVNCLEAALQNMGYVMILCCHGTSAVQAREYAEYLTDQMVDGIFFASFGSDEDYLEKPRAEGIPLIALEDWENFPSDGLVQSADTELAYALVERLIQKGHRKIALIDGPLTKCSARERLEGYRRAMKDYGLLVNEEWISTEEYSEEEGYRQTLRLWKLEDRPTAIFAASYYLNMGVFKAASRLKIEMPEKLSLVAVDDGIFPEIIHPPVTVGVQPLREIAEGACELLKKKMENTEKGSYARVVRPRGKVIVRESIAEPG